MMILSPRSPFKYLPVKMDDYQRLIFDAIRITFEMIEYDYDNLKNKIERVSGTTEERNSSHIFADAWSMIDHTSRLIRLFKKLPSESNHEVLTGISKVNGFRNTIQHLDERIDESMIKVKSPFYGALIWYHKDKKVDKLTPKTLISGLTFGFSINFKIPDVTESEEIINNITLQTVDKKQTISLDLSVLYSDLRELCLLNETKLISFFENQGWELCDWSKRKDIVISLENNLAEADVIKTEVPINLTYLDKK